MDHQKRVVSIVRTQPRYALFHDCGCGKTIAVLAAIEDGKRNGFAGRTLVLAPKSIMQAAWGGDAKHFPDLTLTVCWSAKPAERRKLIASGSDILVTNPETFKKHAEDFLRAGVTRLVIDESSKIKNHASQISQACHRFSDRMTSVLILSGTPAPNDRTEYWSQLRCIDPNIFGHSFYRFAATYFIPQKRRINGRECVTGYLPAACKEPEFFERLRKCSWSLTKEECVDLPEQIDIPRPVTLSDAEFAAYQTMLAECRAELKGGTLNASTTARMMKLRQITGGAIYGGPKEVEVLGTSKLDALVDVLEEIGPKPVVVWAEFTNEIDRIVDRLYAEKIPVRVIDGRSADRADTIERFQRGDVRVLVCQPQAAGHGITLTAASYAVYYSHGYSFETYKQSRDRIHRTGQRHPCTYYHLIAADTVDERVMRALGTKRDAHDEIMDLLSE
jgi:SNF2 family DNA or RNA helicase